MSFELKSGDLYIITPKEKKIRPSYSDKRPSVLPYIFARIIHISATTLVLELEENISCHDHLTIDLSEEIYPLYENCLNRVITIDFVDLKSILPFVSPYYPPEKDGVYGDRTFYSLESNEVHPLMNKLNCYLDGNALCIVGNDFINLQESEAMFIPLTPEQIAEFKKIK